MLRARTGDVKPKAMFSLTLTAAAHKMNGGSAPDHA